MKSTEYVDYIVDLLQPLGNVKTKKMFSGYGVYLRDIFFALILNDILYFKVADQDFYIYQSYGSKPFSYTKKNGKRISLRYWEVPVDIIENNDKFIVWARRAITTAHTNID